MCVLKLLLLPPLSRFGARWDGWDGTQHNNNGETSSRRMHWISKDGFAHSLSLFLSLSIVIESVCRRSKRNKKKKIRHPIHLEGNALSIYSLKRASSSSSSLRIVTERPFDRVEMDTVTSSSRPYCVTCHASPSPRSKVMMMMTIWWRRWPNVDDFPREKVRDRSPFTSSLLLLSFLSLSFLFIP